MELLEKLLGLRSLGAHHDRPIQRPSRAGRINGRQISPTRNISAKMPTITAKPYPLKVACMPMRGFMSAGMSMGIGKLNVPSSAAISHSLSMRYSP